MGKDQGAIPAQRGDGGGLATLRQRAHIHHIKVGILLELVTDLDRPRFRKREGATKALIALGPGVTAQLRKALKATASAETRNRLEQVLRLLHEKQTAQRILESRAVQILELCGTAAARRLLREWAENAAPSLAQEAHAALERLMARSF